MHADIKQRFLMAGTLISGVIGDGINRRRYIVNTLAALLTGFIQPIADHLSDCFW
jgi:hypothetical protein